MAKKARRSSAAPPATRLRVDCHTSERWLQFGSRAQLDVLSQDDLLPLDVMTIGEDGEPHKLCELTVARGDLLRAIAAAGDPPHRAQRAQRFSRGSPE
jgi:hypothetical protein